MATVTSTAGTRRLGAGAAQGGAALLLAAALVLLYWPSVRRLGEEWLHNGNYNHGPLVVALALWLAARADWSRTAWRRSTALFGVGGVLALGALWLMSSAAGMDAIRLSSLPGMLWCGLLAAFGAPLARALVFPLAIVYSAVPVWDYLRPPLQLLTAAAVEPLTGLWGVPVLVEANLVHVPAGTFEIAGGCSGLRFILVAEVIAFCFAAFNGFGKRSTAMLLVLAFLLAMALNVVRVTLVVLVGNATDMTHPWVNDHRHVGWVLFALLWLPFLMVAGKLRRATPGAAPPAAVEAARVRRAPPRPSVVLLALCPPLLALGVAPFWAHQRRVVDAEATPFVLPAASGGWSGPQPMHGGWWPPVPGAAEEAAGAYRRGAGEVRVYASRYLAQSGNAELAIDEHSLLGAGRLLRRTVAERFVELEVEGPADRWLIRYWYVVGSRTTASAAALKLYQGLAVFGPRRAAGVVAVGVPCGADCTASKETLDALLAALRPSLDALYSR